MSRIGIKTKLIFSFLAASLLPLVATNYYSYWKSQDALIKSSLEQVESIRKVTKSRLEGYFETTKSRVSTFAHSRMTVDVLEDFKKGFNNYPKEANLSQVDLLAQKKDLGEFYTSQFGAEYSKQNDGKTHDFRSLLNRLNDSQIAIQSAYIEKNPNGLGQKDKLDAADENTSYNRTHAIYHPNFREMLQKFEYYDIFLIDAETGNIVYSVYKELDFGTSLKTGAFADSGLGRAFQKALTLGEGDSVYMSDYSPYFPSYDSAASFIAAPIFDNGVLKGVAAFQLSFDVVNKITLEKSTQYNSMETFIVGSDYLMRSDTRGDATNRNVKSSFRYPEKGSIKNEHIDMGLRGESFAGLGNDYINRPVVFSVGPLDVLGQRWALKTIVTQDEALAAVSQMRLALIIGALLAAFIVVSIALWYARNLANKLTQVAEGLKGGASIVATTSQQIAEVSTRLSEASTEQAASLQETVASIDEISAMVQRNADSAASSSKTSEASTSAAQRGKEKVELMLDSIHEISKGNEEIMSSIQKSNQEINEIVRVIQAIAEKTKVINDIVFQTKLLSFNASVEAARAGEHGKGFAVVAEEVGNLASMSGKAATEISDMLDKSVQRVTQIVDGTKGMMDSLVKTSKDKVDFGTKTAKECANALDEIMRNVSSVNELVREISTASQEQSTGVREVTKAMAELDQVTQQNTASSNDASHTARELRDQADRLNAFVNELSLIVHGDNSQTVARSSSNDTPKGPSSGSVISIGNFRSSKKVAAKAPSKKVVGLEFEAPASDDNRFEEI